MQTMTIEEANDPAVMRDVLRALDIAHGPGVAKTTRSALKGMFSWAVTRKAIGTNEAANVEAWRVSDDDREATKTGRDPIQRDHDRALTRAEVEQLLRGRIRG